MSILGIIFIFLLFVIIFSYVVFSKSPQKIAQRISGEIVPITKTVVITGGNTGLGYKSARSIACRNLGFRVVIACRNQARAEKAVQDLASQESVRKFCVNSELFDPPLYGIICNAVFTQNTKEIVKTKENIEATFGVGHLGHFLLSNLLIPSVQDKGGIVFLSSDLHDPPSLFGKIEWPDPNTLAYPEKSSVSLSGAMRYCFCKLCNLYVTHELARRLEEKGIHISVNAFNPGMMLDTHQSPDTSAIGRFFRTAFGGLFGYLTGRLGNSEMSAEQVADLITDPKWEGTTGKYIDRGVEKKSSELSYSQRNAEELWRLSQTLTGLDKTV